MWRAKNLFARLFLSATRTTKQRKSRTAGPQSRPSLEQLETRTVPASLQVSLSPHAIVETVGPSSTAVGTVTRVNTDTSQPLTVNLSSSNNAEVNFPASVVIPANQTATTFNVSAVLDSGADGAQNVAITGTAQVLSPAALDPSFAGGSVVQNSITEAVALQTDGKIVTAGLRYNGGNSNYYDFAVSRYNTNGTPDTGFGGTGTVYTDVSGQSDKPYAVAVQADGKIVVAGIGGDGPHFFWELARYNPDGSLDSSFGNGGKVVTNPSPNGYYNEIWDLALQADGKILAAGDMDVGSDGVFAVARYNVNGTLDTTFGSGGIATSNPTVGYSDKAFGVAVDPTSGKIILAGGSKGGNFDSHFALSRFTPSGALDTTFGTSGTVLTDVTGSYEQAQDLVLQPDGKIVAVGYVSPVGVFPPVYNFALARYNANGALDSTFGSGGGVITDFGGNDQAQRVALQADGRIEVVGSGVGTTLSASRTVVADYNPNGTLASSVSTPHSGGALGADVAIQPDGRIVAVSNQGTAFGGYVERYTDSTVISGSDTLAVLDASTPTAVADSYTTGANGTLSVPAATGLLANDTDPNGATLTALQVSAPANGTVAVNADGSFTYTPNAGFYGTDQFTYKDNDGSADSNVATVTITVTLPPPTAVDDTYSVDENGSLTVAAPGVLANDTDPSGSSLTSVLVTQPAHGTLSLSGAGSFTYRPGLNFYGTDSFTYEAYNGSTYSSPATVTITVNHVNQPPTAVNDSYNINQNTTLSIQAPGVLWNDTDPEGDPLTALLGYGPAHGTLNLNPDGSFTYTPNTGYYGADSFTYRANDGNLSSNLATVSLTVNLTDHAPVANNDSYQVNQDSTLTVPASGVLANDTDADGDPLTAILSGNGTAHGSLTLHADGSFVYTPNASYVGTDSFTYRANDGILNSNLATVTITVNHVNHPPVAVADSYSLNEDQTLTVAAGPGTTTLVMHSQTGDYIGQGQNYSYSSLTGTFGVSRNFDNGVSFNYQDTLNSGAWWFLDFAAPGKATLVPGTYLNATRYPFQDPSVPGLDVAGEGRGSNTLTGQFTVVQAIYDPSGTVLRYDATFVQHSEGATPALTGEINYSSPNAPAGVLHNDSDPDGNSLTAILVTGPSHGTLTLNPDGSLVYTPSANFNGTDSFTYEANDGSLNSNVATVTLTVNPVNDAPTFAKGADQTLVEGAGAQTVPGWATAISAGPPNESGQALNFLVSTTNNALFSAVPAIDPATGTLTYTPAPGALGTATVSVRLHDNGGTANGGVDTSPVQTFVITVNDATPTLTLGGASSVNEGSPYTLNLSAVDPDTITRWTITWGDGTVDTVPGNPSSATHVYAHGPNQYSVSATATDEDGTFDAANTVGVTVNPVHLSLTAPAGVTAGAVFGVTVTVLDPSGALDTDYSGTIHFTSSAGAATLPGDYTFVAADAGSHAFNNALILDTAGTQTVTATDTADGTIGGALSESVSPAAATDFVVSAPATATAGTAFTATITALDAFNNVATGYTGTVHFASSDGQATLPADSTLTNGSGSFAVTLAIAGAQSVTATDTTDPSVTGTQGNIAVSPASASTLVLTGFPSTTTAGDSHGFTITARDAYGNTATGYLGTVHFTSSDGQAALPANYTFTATDAGVHTFSATLKTAGTQSLTATDTADGSSAGTTGNISVSAATAASLTVAGFPAPTTAGVAHTITLTVRDAFGNVASGYLGTVHFTSTDAQAGLPSDYTFTAADAGVHSISVTLKTAGTQTVTATDKATPSLAGTQSGITVTAAATAGFSVTGYASPTTAGTAHTFTVTARDAFGNVTTGYVGTVHFTSTDGQAALPADYTFKAADAGVHSFSATLKTAGTQSLTATDKAASSINGVESGLTVVAGAATHFSISAPANVSSGKAFQIIVTALDAYGNVATGYRGTVHLTSSDHKATLPSNYTFVSGDNGVHTFTVTLKSRGTQSLTATDTKTGSITGSDTLNVS